MALALTQELDKGTGCDGRYAERKKKRDQSIYRWFIGRPFMIGMDGWVEGGLSSVSKSYISM